MSKSKDILSQESGTSVKSWEGKLKIALAFPNTYYVGMSNLGYQTLYRLLNLADDTVCERVFLPGRKSSDQHRSTAKPLRSFESNRPLHAFHIIAFCLSFENDYLNILQMLRRANIPLLQKERGSSYPLVLGGGIASFLNPEPLAEIFDMFILGEAEEVIAEFLEVYRQKRPTRRKPKLPLKMFAHIAGIYVPSAYQVSYHEDGTIKKFTPAKGFPARITRRWVKNLNKFPVFSSLSTPYTEFSNMALLEVSRGCPRRCRFCAVGHVYRPYRSRKLAVLQQTILNSINRQSKIGLLGAAVCDYPYLAALIRSIVAKGGKVSISSLRVDALTEEIVGLLKESGHKTFSIAPEAGSERLRKVINKDLTNAEIFQTVTLLARNKIASLKLYFLVGLPTEDEKDVASIVDLTKRIKHFYCKEARGEQSLHQILVSISTFVPKPLTPFQWHPFGGIRELKQRLKLVSSGLKKEKKITVTFDLPKWGYIQTLLSRGDRRVSGFLLTAFNRGGDWTQAFKELALNPDFYVYRERRFNELLPWDFIDHKLDKKTLWREYQKALQTA